MKHQGQQLKHALKTLGMKKTTLAKRLKTSRVTLDKHIADGKFNEQHSAIVKTIIEQSKNI